MADPLDLEAIKMMRECIVLLERGVRELDSINDAQWDWQLSCVAAARRRLRLKHDREIAELAAELAAEALEEAEWDSDAECLGPEGECDDTHNDPRCPVHGEEPEDE